MGDALVRWYLDRQVRATRSADAARLGMIEWTSTTAGSAALAPERESLMASAAGGDVVEFLEGRRGEAKTHREKETR